MWHFLEGQVQLGLSPGVTNGVIFYRLNQSAEILGWRIDVFTVIHSFLRLFIIKGKMSETCL